MRSPLGFLSVLAVTVVLCASPARADDKSDITALTQKYVAALRAGDVSAAAALGAPAQQSVIDDFPPHYWNGPNALANWQRGFMAATKEAGDTDLGLTLSAPKYSEINGKRAWATFPLAYSFKEKGAVTHEAGVLSMAFEKVAAGWRILAFGWARNS